MNGIVFEQDHVENIADSTRIICFHFGRKKSSFKDLNISMMKVSEGVTRNAYNAWFSN